MIIKESDLTHLVEEETIKMFQIEKLEEAKRLIANNLQLIAEGKEPINEEELNELLAGLRNLFSKGAKKVGSTVQKGANNAINATKQFGNDVGDSIKANATDAVNTAKKIGNDAAQFGNKVAQTYKDGEAPVIKARKEDKRDKIAQKIIALAAQYKALTGKPYVRVGQALANVV